MAVEIELKAHVENPEALKAAISLLAAPPLSFEKDDCYWTPADYCPPSSLSRFAHSNPQKSPSGDFLPCKLPKEPDNRGFFAASRAKNPQVRQAPRAVSAGLPKSGVRIRRENTTHPDGKKEEKVLVTYKSKEVREGIEINDEREFTVSDGDTFGELLKRLGLLPGVQKHKQGWAFTYRNIYAELCEVSGEVSGNKSSLGWFLELEILVEEAGSETVAAARKELLGLLEKLKVGKDCIEERYYTEMLGKGRSQ